ncbi:hypothetical protein Tco_0239622, partial [Tanacetum coccineum]
LHPVTSEPMSDSSISTFYFTHIQNTPPVIVNLPPPLLIQDRKDVVLRKSNDGKAGSFSAKKVWSDIVVSVL